MGYSRPLAVLSFDNPVLEGFEVKMRPVPLARFFELQASWSNDSELTRDEKNALARSTFIDHVASWNLETDDGQPVPVDLAAFEAYDFAWVDSVIGGWISTLLELPAPLGTGSTSGPSLAAVPIPMVPLSESQAS